MSDRISYLRVPHARLLLRMSVLLYQNEGGLVEGFAQVSTGPWQRLLWNCLLLAAEMYSF